MNLSFAKITQINEDTPFGCYPPYPTPLEEYREDFPRRYFPILRGNPEHTSEILNAAIFEVYKAIMMSKGNPPGALARAKILNATTGITFGLKDSQIDQNTYNTVRLGFNDAITNEIDVLIQNRRPNSYERSIINTLNDVRIINLVLLATNFSNAKANSRNNGEKSVTQDLAALFQIQAIYSALDAGYGIRRESPIINDYFENLDVEEILYTMRGLISELNFMRVANFHGLQIAKTNYYLDRLGIGDFVAESNDEVILISIKGEICRNAIRVFPGNRKNLDDILGVNSRSVLVMVPNDRLFSAKELRDIVVYDRNGLL